MTTLHIPGKQFNFPYNTYRKNLTTNQKIDLTITKNNESPNKIRKPNSRNRNESKEMWPFGWEGWNRRRLRQKGGGEKEWSGEQRPTWKKPWRKKAAGAKACTLRRCNRTPVKLASTTSAAAIPRDLPDFWPWFFPPPSPREIVGIGLTFPFLIMAKRPKLLLRTL